MVRLVIWDVIVSIMLSLLCFFLSLIYSHIDVILTPWHYVDFADIFKGQYNGEQVAIRALKNHNDTTEQQFLTEAAIMTWVVYSFPSLSLMAPKCRITIFGHQMETFSALLALCAGNSPVIDEIPSQRPVTRSFDVFFHLRLNKRLSK